jgi:aminoglycoside phosphotransferase (APT) family kinase protein
VHRLAVDGVPTAYAKQGGWAAHADSDDAVGCERRALSILAASGLVPQLIGPAACDVVWTRALQPCTGLTDVIRCGRTAELLLALRAWGTALAALHRWPAGIGDPPAAPKPWILEPSKAPEHLRLASSHRGAGNRVAVVLAELQRNGAVRDALATVRAGWSRTCWTHGDATTSNGVARAVDRQHWRVWLLDLESAGLGDPSWDLATAYDSLLVHRANLGRTMRPAVRALLDGYRCGDGPGRLSRELLIARAALTCVQLAASSDRQLSGRAGTAGRPAHRVPA